LEAVESRFVRPAGSCGPGPKRDVLALLVALHDIAKGVEDHQLFARPARAPQYFCLVAALGIERPNGDAVASSEQASHAGFAIPADDLRVREIAQIEVAALDQSRDPHGLAHESSFRRRPEVYG